MSNIDLNPDQLAESAILSGADPYALFDEWFAAAKTSEPNDPNAVALATATPDGAPSARMVLLKEYGPSDAPAHIGGGGFTFYTNAHSRKGQEIRANAQASMLFHWKSLRRQIRIEGELHEVSPERADAYFHSRPFKSQVGSAASDQSRPLANRDEYLARVDALRAQHAEAGRVPRPAHWTGFTLVPQAIEFWMDRDNRLHDRRRFTRVASGDWTDTLLYP